MTDETKPFYVIYPDETVDDWRVQAVPVSPDSFESRKALPEAWRGLRFEELSEVSGIEGGIFVHASGFIGGVCARPALFGPERRLLPHRKQNQGWGADARA